MKILAGRRLLALLGALAATAGGCGGGGEGADIGPAPAPRGGYGGSPATTAPAAALERAEEAREPTEGEGAEGARARKPDPAHRSDPAAAAVATVRAYVAALSERDGKRACRLLAPGALDEVPLPRPRGGCAASLRASIGYRDPRGRPVFEEAEISSERVELEGESARVVATILTRFADRSQPSFEDDIIYLRRDGDRWRIVKASSVLHRAIGIADVPFSAISPP